MKISRIFQLFLCSCLPVLLMTSCEEEPAEQQEQPVQFSFNGQYLPQNGRIGDLNDARAIIITIKSASGETVLSMEKIPLYNLSNDSNNSSFISEPVSLKPGDYAITDFLVVDEDDDVIYVTPKEGSEKSHLVNDPLPVQFAVVANNVNEIDVQVVDATSDPVESFGYATFAIHEVNTLKFRIQAFITAYENEYEDFTSYQELTDAHIEVYLHASRDHKLFEGNISPNNNLVEISDFNLDSYYIIVSKQFYKPYEKYISREALVSSQTDPIKVMLENKATFTHILSSDETIFSQLVPPGDHSKLFYTTTTDKLYKVDISDLNNPGSPVLVGEYTGYLGADYFGNLYLDNYYSTDNGETWTAITEETPRAFAEINGTYFGRIGSKLYGKSGSGEWQLLSELPPYTNITAYQDRLYTAPSDFSSEIFYVTEDGINFEEVPANVIPVYNYIFPAGDKLFLNTSTDSYGYIVVWNGTNWSIDNAVYEWDPQVNSHFFITGYKNNILLVENNRVRVMQLNNCSPGNCPIQTIATHDPEYVYLAYPTIRGRQIAGDVLFLNTFTDRNGKMHVYAMDLSTLELE